LRETGLSPEAFCPLSIAVVFVLMFTFVIVGGWLQRRNRSRLALEQARQLGFSLMPRVDPLFAERIRRAYPPSVNARVSNVAYLRQNELTIYVFDVAANRLVASKSQTDSEQGVIALVSPLLNLPPFLLVSRPAALESIGLMTHMVELVLKKLGLAFGYRQVSFAIDSEFDHRYLLFTNNEEAVKAFFSDSLVSLLAATDGYFVRATGDTLLFSSFNLARIKKPAAVGQISAGLDQARQFYGWILDKR